jgi:hypothetical protein
MGAGLCAGDLAQSEADRPGGADEAEAVGGLRTLPARSSLYNLSLM